VLAKEPARIKNLEPSDPKAVFHDFEELERRATPRASSAASP